MSLLSAIVLVPGLLAPGMQAEPLPQLRYRWVYVQTNFLVKDNVAKLDALLDRAKRAGYNGVVVTDSKFALLQRMPATYFENLRSFRSKAEALGLALFPAVTNPGYAGDLLSNDPNLAEGMPVREAPFVVRDGRADIVSADRPIVANGSFEASNGNAMAGWAFQDQPGRTTFADTQVRHGGRQSLRMDSPAQTNTSNKNGRIHQELQVQPWRQYHVSAWVKTEAFRPASDVRVQVLTADGRSLTFNALGVRPTQDWTQVHAVFNSQSYDTVRLYLGIWGGGTGRLWLDDVEIEAVGLLNVVRRPGCPLTVKSESGTTFEEGRDYEPVADPRMGTVPWPGGYEVFHKPPPIRLTPGSRIADGQRLLVSYYHNVIVYDGSVACCLSEPEVFSLMKDSASRLQAAVKPKGYLLAYDEIRNANWCHTCTARKLTPGLMLADHFRQMDAAVRKLDGSSLVLAWSDMFDPNHNAHGDYYLVNGSWSGSWEGLPKEAIVLNWLHGSRKTLDFFAARGNRQVLAGYYDTDPARIAEWLRAAAGVKGVEGVMYTTWVDRYDDLEAFAKAAWGGGSR